MSLRDTYNNNLQLAHLVMHLYAAGMSKEVQPPKVFEEMIKESRKKKVEETKVWFADASKLTGFGIAAKKPKKSSGKGTASPPAASSATTQQPPQTS